MLIRLPSAECVTLSTRPRVSCHGELLDEQRIHHMPHRTVSWYVDRQRSRMVIFSEPDPHPDDWQMAVGYLRRIAPGADLRERMEGCVVTFEAAIADLSAWPVHTDECPDACMHLDPGTAA